MEYCVMTWAGEDAASGIMAFTGGDTPTSIVGDNNRLLHWNIVLGPQFCDVAVDSSGTITMPGGQIVNGVIVSGVSYNVQQTDWLVISTATEKRTVFLPTNPTVWQCHNVKDGAGNSKSKKLVINGNGNTIDGFDTVTINGNYTSITVVYNGAEWNII